MERRKKISYGPQDPESNLAVNTLDFLFVSYISDWGLEKSTVSFRKIIEQTRMEQNNNKLGGRILIYHIISFKMWTF